MEAFLQTKVSLQNKGMTTMWHILIIIILLYYTHTQTLPYNLAPLHRWEEMYAPNVSSKPDTPDKQAVRRPDKKA